MPFGFVVVNALVLAVGLAAGRVARSALGADVVSRRRFVAITVASLMAATIGSAIGLLVAALPETGPRPDRSMALGALAALRPEAALPLPPAATEEASLGG